MADDEILLGESDVPKSLWPLKTIVAKGLLGREKELILDLEPDMTVLTGENGSGKSTLLKAIYMVGTGRWYDLSGLAFESLALIFADGFELTVDNRFEPPTIQSPSGEWTPPEVEAEDSDDTDDPRIATDEEADWLGIPRGYFARDPSDLRDELAHRRGYGSQADLRRRGLRGEPVDDDRPTWVREVEEGLRVAFVTTRRLEDVRGVRDPRMPPGAGRNSRASRIELVSRSLSRRIRAEILGFTKSSNEADREFPQKVVKAMEVPGGLNTDSLGPEVEWLEEKVRDLAVSLARVGLLPGARDEVLSTEARGKSGPVLLFLREFYLDRLQRLEELDDLKRVLEVFSAFAADRFTGKEVAVTADDGLIVTLENGTQIAPEQLSSGEQQLIVIAYQLLFQTRPRSVVLVDEPELSLHVAWLRGLIEAFVEIGELRELQYVLATHSPSLIAGHSENERSLDLLMSS